MIVRPLPSGRRDRRNLTDARAPTARGPISIVVPIAGPMETAARIAAGISAAARTLRISRGDPVTTVTISSDRRSGPTTRISVAVVMVVVDPHAASRVIRVADLSSKRIRRPQAAFLHTR